VDAASWAGGDLVNSAGDAAAWAAKHPGETLFVLVAGTVVIATCYMSCEAILAAAAISAGGDLSLACFAGCTAAASMAIPTVNLGVNLWNWSNADDPSKQVDEAALVGLPDMPSPESAEPAPVVTNPALRNARGWFVSPKPLWK
jgi:hypothetical protein